MNKSSTSILVSISIEMFEWLEKPENKRNINRSQLFQNAVADLMHPRPKRIPPMSLLVILMGMSFGVGCIIGAMSMNFDFLFKATLYMLGFVVLLASVVTIIKEVRAQARLHSN